MSTDSTGTEVFEEIDPDPDAILEEFDIDSPDDIDDGAGAHDPATDDELAVDDTTAAELFADLQQVATDASADGEAAAGTAQSDDSADSAGSDDDLEFEFIGDADVTVRADGAVVESSAAELSALTTGDSDPATDGDSADGPDTADSSDGNSTSEGVSPTLTVRSGDELELVGPEPTPTRVTNDSFSHGDAAAQ